MTELPEDNPAEVAAASWAVNPAEVTETVATSAAEVIRAGEHFHDGFPRLPDWYVQPKPQLQNAYQMTTPPEDNPAGETTEDNPAEEPEKDPAEKAAADSVADPLEATEAVATSAAEVTRANEQLRDGLAKVRDGFEQLKAQLRSANGLATTSVDLLTEFRRTADTLTAERQGIERAEAALVTREQAVEQDLAEKRQSALSALEAEIANIRTARLTEISEAENAERARVRSQIAKERSDWDEIRTQQQQDSKQQQDELERQKGAVAQGLAYKRQSALSALEAEIANIRTTRLTEISEAENAERARVRSQIAKERSDWDEIRTQQQLDLKQQQDELERQKGAVAALQSELEGRRVELDGNELDFERRADRIRRQVQRRSENLDEELARMIAEERKSFESTLQAAVNECASLRESIQSQAQLLGAFEQLQQQLGGHHPGTVIHELNRLRDEIRRAEEELATRPTEEMRSQFTALEFENHSLQNRVEELTRQLEQKKALAAQSSDLMLRNGNLAAENKSLEQKAKIFESAANEAETELNRLRAAYERPAEIKARYKEIELPVFKAADITPLSASPDTEVQWLDGIAKACNSYGFHFNPRILWAFHTSLKTADWSPLTVLAGVSGTGKSELPRLYSHFGGLYFQPLAVQPNWDSQESMLGFFNSIDNRFDAQPVLRFLAQSQKPWADRTDDSEGYPGLNDAVCLVLLDEMNLAHPELYFAEFLSKLELRRGTRGGNVPRLPVKIGAGMEPYQLLLGRNVLWAGTMNQDETTKSLSDKVLDRSIIIHFPRPTDLKRRSKLAPLAERGAYLPRRVWQSWTVRDILFTEDEIKPYKKFIETMNASLEVVGRAIGHRVWQSIEYYMANYPDVIAADDSTKKTKAMHVAFEDQLVQKVMPKLRGIDTRGKSKTECLDKIRNQLVRGIGGNGFHLAEDFDLAEDFGYGQFIWQSANYLNGKDADVEVEDADESA
jgi:3'-phosphoadenosine 5'-phosphosulfate sulfotransferase